MGHVRSIIHAIRGTIHNGSASHKSTVAVTVDTTTPFEKVCLFHARRNKSANFGTNSSAIVVYFNFVLLSALHFKGDTSSSPGRVTFVRNSGGSAARFLAMGVLFTLLTLTSKTSEDGRFLFSSAADVSWRALRGSLDVLSSDRGIFVVALFRVDVGIVDVDC